MHTDDLSLTEDALDACPPFVFLLLFVTASLRLLISEEVSTLVPGSGGSFEVDRLVPGFDRIRATRSLKVFRVRNLHALGTRLNSLTIPSLCVSSKALVLCSTPSGCLCFELVPRSETSFQRQHRSDMESFYFTFRQLCTHYVSLYATVEIALSFDA